MLAHAAQLDENRANQIVHKLDKLGQVVFELKHVV